jgi:hypothetical protein
MSNANDLVDPRGRPLIQEVNLIVIKEPKSIRLPKELLSGISQVTHCAVIELPLSCELMKGDIAEKEMESTHSGIHAISGLPDINFNKEELSTLYAAMRYLCERTSPSDGSGEVKLMKRLKKVAA